MDYSHIVLIPVLYVFVKKISIDRSAILLILFMLLEVSGFKSVTLPLMNELRYFLNLFYPLFISLWLFFMANSNKDYQHRLS
jgi:hypothetical protein